MLPYTICKAKLCTLSLQVGKIMRLTCAAATKSAHAKQKAGPAKAGI